MLRNVKLRAALATSGYLACLLLSGCGAARSHALRSEREREVVADTALFAAVVRELESLPKVPARVDPRPTVLNGLTPAAVPEEVVAARAAVLRRMQVATTDALADAKCPGVTLLFRAAPVPKTGCPESGQYDSYILSLPHPGRGRVDEESARTSGGGNRWFVRVVSRTMGPDGAAGAVDDYLFTRTREGRWRFDGRVNLVVE